MKEITIEELRSIELSMLQYIDKICLENDIQYFVFYGSLIGAIRHNGFIPWDDDIDIVLTRENYEKLIEILMNKTSDYVLLDYRVQKDYFYPYAKLIDPKTSVSEELFESIRNYGLFIDIFPLDNIPSDIEKQNKRTKELLFCQKLAYWWSMDVTHEQSKIKKAIKIILKKITKLYGLERIMKKYDKISMQYNQISTEYCTHNFPVPTCQAYHKKDLEMAIRHQFENIEINIPKNYDKILTDEYGDYMKLPPEEKRISNHSMKYYWKN